MIFKEAAEDFAECGAKAAHDALTDASINPDEDSITWHFIKNFEKELELAVEDTRYGLYANKFRDNYKLSPETIYGADFLIIVGVLTQDGITGAGIISQAKLKDKNPKDPIQSLQKDCKKMVNISPSSYVAVYYNDYFSFYNADRILTIDSKRFHAQDRDLRYTVPHRQTRLFLLPLLRGFSGDRYIFENYEGLLNPDNYSISSRAAWTDGGEPLNDEHTIHSLILLFDKTGEQQEWNYDPYEELPFNEERLQDMEI